jgi:hypothetical protein
MSFWRKLFGNSHSADSPLPRGQIQGKQLTPAANNDNRFEQPQRGSESDRFRKEVDASINYSVFRSIASEQVLPDHTIKEFCTYWLQDYNPYNPQETTRFHEVVERKRLVREFCDELRALKYNTESKTWLPFEIERQFCAVRKLLINHKQPFPEYLWNLVNGNPFDRIYRVCRDYAKSTKNVEIAKELFHAVVKWESGDLIPKEDARSSCDTNLWVNWNTIVKDILSIASLRKQDNYASLVHEISLHVHSQVEYYKSFGDGSLYAISLDTLSLIEERIS